jgi:type IV secretory pathway VirB10-like protein
LPTYFTKKEPKKEDNGQMEALKAYADMLDKKADEQKRIMEQFAANAASGGGGKASDGLTVDPELALIQAQINPRTGQPRQRASEIARSVGLAMVPAGTILHLRNVSRIETQLGGTCLAVLERDVWDAQMKAIVLPRGSKVLGVIQMVGGEAQNRAAVVFRQIVDPNGDQVQLLVEQPAMNGIGMTGIEGSVNHHFGVKWGSALAWGLVSGLAGNGAASPSSPGSNFGDVVRTNVASSFGQVGQSYLQQTTNIRSDIEVPENTSMKIVIGSPIYLRPWREIRPF